MRVRVTLRSLARGGVAAECAEYAGCRVEAAGRAEALARMRAALAYDRELCPCDVTADAGLELEVVEEDPPAP